MRGRTTDRVGAGAGLLFVVLSLLGAFIYPQQPQAGSPAATTLAWVHDHRVALQVGMILALFAAASFLWFAAYLRVVLASAGDRAKGLAPMIFGAGIAVAVIDALAAVPTALLAFMAAQPAGIPDATVVRMLADLNLVLFAASSVMTGLFLLAAGLAMLRGVLATAWLGWLSLVVAAFNGVAVWVGVTFSSYHGKAWNVVGWGAFIGFLVVTVILSGSLLSGRRAVPSAVPSVAVSSGAVSSGAVS